MASDIKRSSSVPVKSAPTVKARARASLDSASATYSKLRDSAAKAATHPAVGKASDIAQGLVARVREVLGRSHSVLAAEAATGVDRVLLVTGGVLLFTLLIPFNLFGLAHATSTALCFGLPSIRALSILEANDQSDTRNLLSYFVIVGYFQVVEGIFGNLIRAAFARYYLFKIAVAFWLGHFKGAEKVYDLVLRGLIFDSKAKVSSPISEDSSYSDLGDYRSTVEPADKAQAKAPVPVKPQAPVQAPALPQPLLAKLERIQTAIKNAEKNAEKPKPASPEQSKPASPVIPMKPYEEPVRMSGGIAQRFAPPQ